MVAVVERPAEPGATTRPAPRQPPRSEALSPRAYWLLALSITALSLLLWLTHFQYVYGWVNDDRYLFVKGLETVHDWKRAFAYYNALQPYFYLVSYLPLWSGLSLPSYPLPLFGAQTGQFRFFLLYTVFLHAGILLVWAWFAPRLTNRLVALLSLFLLASSPSFILWTPQPESRLLGLPLGLLGFWLLSRVESGGLQSSRQAALLFLTGSVLWLAQTIHYTVLYVIGPVCLAFFGMWLWRHRRERAAWLGVVAFGLGGLWPQALMEAVSYFLVGIPWERGPTMSMFGLRVEHLSPWPAWGNFMVFGESFLSQFGVPLLAAIGAGWAVYVRQAAAAGKTVSAMRLAIALGMPIGLVYLWVGGSMPFFRQTSVLQPFLFLFASLTLVMLAERLRAGRAARFAALVILVAGVGIVPWLQARDTFLAHQAVGRALEWAETHRGDHRLDWLRIAWFGGDRELDSVDALMQAPADTWLISYFPMLFVDVNPTLQPALAKVAPLAAWPSLYATDTLRAEHKGYGYNDFRTDSLLSQVRIVELGEVQRALQTAPLAARAVTADSQNTTADEPVNVFDRDSSPDGATTWVSADTPGPHWLDVQFAAPVTLGEAEVVLPTRDAASKDQFASRISSLEIEATDATGSSHPVWSGDRLERYPVITARWPAQPTKSLRFVVHRQTMPTSPTNQATIAEIVFPGYQVEAPPTARAFAPLGMNLMRVADAATLAGDRMDDGELRRFDAPWPDARPVVISVRNPTRYTAFVVDGVRSPLRELPSGDMLAWIHAGAPSARREAYLTDGFRRSEEMSGPPVLQQIDAGTTPADRLARRLPDGRFRLDLVATDAPPGTMVTFDGLELPTAPTGAGRLNALIPEQAFTRPGRHTVALRGALGDSNTQEFVQDEEPPLVLRQLSTTRTPPGQVFAPRADGQAALYVDAENATPNTVIMFGTTPLPTDRRTDRWLVASVPAALYAQPGRYPVRLTDGVRESNRLDFVVQP